MEKSLFNSMMRKASLASYAVGVFAIASSIVSSILTAPLSPIETAISSGSVSASTISQFSQLMNALLPFSLAISAVTLLLSIVFAYFNLGVGRAYDVGPLRIGVISYVVYQLAAIPAVIGAYELIPVLAQAESNPGNETAILGQALGTLILIGIAGLLTLIFLVLFIVTFLMGLNGMKRETELGLFGTALWLTLIGIILSLLNGFIFAPLGVPVNIGDLILQIAIVVFGFALSKAAKEGRVPVRLRDRIASTQA